MTASAVPADQPIVTMPFQRAFSAGALPVIERELLAVARLARTYTVGVSGRVRSAHGSGVVWRHDGLVVTNAHVARESRLILSLYDEREVEARLVARDTQHDLALLVTNARGLLIGPPGDPWSMHSGSIVLAAEASMEELAPLSLGLLRQITYDDLGDPKWITSDIRIPLSAAGGPLIDTRARVLGVCTATVSGLGTAVPVNVIQRFIREAELGGLIPTRGSLAA
jgi:serine protease Do